MVPDSPLQISRFALSLMGTRMHTYYQNRIPGAGAVLVVSNHRSVMDAPVLMAALNRSVHFACHHYMGQVPVMRDIVARLGCFPLEAPNQRQHFFFKQATQLLQTQQAVGVFPEGAEPMVQETLPCKVGSFHRGFAHLALRAPVRDLVVLPVAIASTDEVSNAFMPLRLFSLFDPTEPLFDRDEWHPMVWYKRVNVLIGRPQWISTGQRELYQGKQAKSLVAELSQQCSTEIDDLLRQGCY